MDRNGICRREREMNLELEFGIWFVEIREVDFVWSVIVFMDRERKYFIYSWVKFNILSNHIGKKYFLILLNN